MNIIYLQRLAYCLCYDSMSVSLDPIADVTYRYLRPYDLEGIGASCGARFYPEN